MKQKDKSKQRKIKVSVGIFFSLREVKKIKKRSKVERGNGSQIKRKKKK